VIFGDNPDALLEGDYEVSDDGYVDMDGEGIVNISDDYDLEHSLSPPENEAPDKDEDDFLANLLPSTETDNKGKDSKTSSQLAFTFSCPITHQEMLQLMKDIPVQDTPTVVQRIRILYHPKLAAENKTKLQNFAPVLLEHIIYLANLRVIKIPFLVIDTLVRHLHALAKSFPEIAAKSYRCHLKEIHESRINGDLRPGDLVMLTTIATIFPTSDQFHPVVTPAMVIMCKWLGQVVPNSIGIMAMGSYVITLCIQYQTLSQRYVPELVGYILRGILQLIPIGTQTIPGYFPYEETDVFRIQNVPSDWEPRKLSFSDIFDPSEDTPFAVLQSFFALLNQLFQLWAAKNSFLEIFEPVEKGLSHLLTKECRGKFGPVLKNQLLSLSNELSSKLSKARPLRRPLELHHHRPLPIPSNIPKFEEDYNMDKRYDPNVERRELTKLKAEHKREKKGAVREIRKDSRFISRVKLAEDKETSKAYHAKMARLTAMIQSEEGAAANEYKRQKASRR
jgi:nucleolar protein 14